MHCSACATRIQRSLDKLPAVASASVNLATHRAFVSYDPTLAATTTCAGRSTAVGYAASPVAEAAPGGRPDPDHWRVRAAISWPLALAALVVALVARRRRPPSWTVLVLAVAVEIAGGWPFLRNSARLAPPRRHEHGHPHRPRHPGRPGRQRRRGGGPRRPPPPPGRQRGVRRPAARGDGPAHRGHPGDRPGGRGPGPGPGRRGHALAAVPPPPDGPGRGRRSTTTPGELVAPESVPVGALVRVRPGEALPLDGTVARAGRRSTSRC